MTETVEPKRIRPGRRSIPQELQRRLLWGRVDPTTEEFLKRLEAPNMGRAIDKAVGLLKTLTKQTPPDDQLQG